MPLAVWTRRVAACTGQLIMTSRAVISTRRVLCHNKHAPSLIDQRWSYSPGLLHSTLTCNPDLTANALSKHDCPSDGPNNTRLYRIKPIRAAVMPVVARGYSCSTSTPSALSYG